MLEQPGVEGLWSVKQIVAHIAGYEEGAAAFLTDRRDPAGAMARFDAFWQQELDTYRRDRPDVPAQLDDTDADQTNALVVALYDRSPATVVLERERQIYQQLLAATRALPASDFRQPWRPGGRALLEILLNQSYAHYPMHMPAIRRWLE